MLNFHISCPSIRRFKSVMQEIATIEAQCYPKYMWSLQSINNREDLQYYCESEDVFVLQNNTTYLICTRDEVVDFASSVKLSLTDVVKIKEFLMNTFGNNVLEVREQYTKKEAKMIAQEIINAGKKLVVFKSFSKKSLSTPLLSISPFRIIFPSGVLIILGNILSPIKSKRPPHINPIVTITDPLIFKFSDIDSAGEISEKNDADIITPAAKPSIASSSVLLTFLNKNTTIAPKMVISHVNKQATKAKKILL